MAASFDDGNKMKGWIAVVIVEQLLLQLRTGGVKSAEPSGMMEEEAGNPVSETAGDDCGGGGDGGDGDDCDRGHGCSHGCDLGHHQLVLDGLVVVDEVEDAGKAMEELVGGEDGGHGSGKAAGVERRKLVYEWGLVNQDLGSLQHWPLEVERVGGRYWWCLHCSSQSDCL